MISILIVDDQLSIKVGVAQMLRDHGYQVRAAGDAEEALRLFEQEPAALLITDLRLPGQSGMELIRQAKSKNPAVACILISAYVTLEDALEAVRLGVADIFSKPFDNQKLLLRVKELHRQSGSGLRDKEQGYFYGGPRRGILGRWHAIQRYRSGRGAWRCTGLKPSPNKHWFVCVPPGSAQDLGYFEGLLQGLRVKSNDFITVLSDAKPFWDPSIDSAWLEIPEEGLEQKLYLGGSLEAVFHEPGKKPICLHSESRMRIHELPGHPEGFWILGHKLEGISKVGAAPFEKFRKARFTLAAERGLMQELTTSLPQANLNGLLFLVPFDQRRPLQWEQKFCVHQLAAMETTIQQLRELLELHAFPRHSQVRSCVGLAEWLDWHHKNQTKKPVGIKLFCGPEGSLKMELENGGLAGDSFLNPEPPGRDSLLPDFLSGSPFLKELQVVTTPAAGETGAGFQLEVH